MEEWCSTECKEAGDGRTCGAGRCEVVWGEERRCASCSSRAENIGLLARLITDLRPLLRPAPPTHPPTSMLGLRFTFFPAGRGHPPFVDSRLQLVRPPPIHPLLGGKGAPSFLITKGNHPLDTAVGTSFAPKGGAHCTLLPRMLERNRRAEP
jgi:hypothetical protein